MLFLASLELLINPPLLKQADKLPIGSDPGFNSPIFQPFPSPLSAPLSIAGIIPDLIRDDLPLPEEPMIVVKPVFLRFVITFLI